MSFVALPDPIKVSITALIVWAVAWLFAKVITLVPFLSFLDPFKEPIALAIAAALIGAFEQAIPDAYAQVAIVGVQLLLAILALFGVGKQLGKQGFRAFK